MGDNHHFITKFTNVDNLINSNCNVYNINGGSGQVVRTRAGAYFCATQGEAQRAGGKGRRERPICETKRGEVLLKLNDFKGFST